jgi:Na+/H+ antiporter NhaD/arsenite permease-like protein
VLFIFIVSNTGGALTPIGDPPLFLGYLKGVPFFWLLSKPNVVLAWLLTVGLLLAIFFVMDTLNYRQHKGAVESIEFEGTHNFIWLFVIIGLVLVQKADWLKGYDDKLVTLVIAGLMVAVAALSYKFANRDALGENEFSFGPVKEVGFLFVGIFATMVPALDLLEKHAAGLGITTVRQFYWGSGALSSVLDNAPTYLNFLTAAFGLQHRSLEVPADVTHFLSHPALSQYIVAVSLGSVFFGANTYIGNGPNFMVKSIAESAGVKCPSFFGYVVKYSLPILLPIFAVVAWLFLR